MFATDGAGSWWHVILYVLTVSSFANF